MVSLQQPFLLYWIAVEGGGVVLIVKGVDIEVVRWGEVGGMIHKRIIPPSLSSHHLNKTRRNREQLPGNWSSMDGS